MSSPAVPSPAPSKPAARGAPSDTGLLAAALCEALAGLVERVMFHNAESGFCVLRVKARGQRDLVSVVGLAAQISAGEWVSATGVWVNDRQHGLQFKADHLAATQPTTVEGIEKYLGSGMVRGVGPVRAERIAAGWAEQKVRPRPPALRRALPAPRPC